MTAQADPYSRFYWRFRDEYADIYADKETFGWWMTLLATAEGAHPSAPEMPRRIKPRNVQALVDAELLELLPNDRYRLRGVAEEVERRSSRGKAGASARWNERTPDAMRTHSERNANGMPRRDETRLDKTSKDETRQDAPAGAEKNGSKNRETDEERMAGYIAIVTNPKDYPEWKVDAAKAAIDVWETQRRVN